MLFKRLSFYLAVAGIVSVVLLVKGLSKTPPVPPPLTEPARSPFSNAVAATGMIEAARENVKIATPKAGLVQKVFVQVGSKVKAGDPLFQLDHRESLARLATAQSQLETIQAALEMERVLLADLTDQYQRVLRLERDKVATEDERLRKSFALNSSKARLIKAEADVKTAQSQLEQAKVDRDILTVRAPRDGTLLQVSLREGEHAGLTPVEPLMILGETDSLQIRADVDEQNAPLIAPGQQAVAFLKGDTTNPMPLQFIRIEPYVIPKRSLTGDSAERVDTRVLQIIFALERPQGRLYVGQQVDVFIDRATQVAEAK